MSSLLRWALEASLLGKILGADAEIDIEGTKLSTRKLQALQKHPKLLDALDAWVLIADMRLLPELRELAKIINKLYGFDKKLRLYRGLEPKSRFQDTMGLSEKGFFSVAVRNFSEGHRFRYASKERPLSFTTELQIARAFGSVVTATDIEPAKQPCLIITDELSEIIRQRRNLPKLMTQKEVILFPPFDLEFVVQEKTNG